MASNGFSTQSFLRLATYVARLNYQVESQADYARVSIEYLPSLASPALKTGLGSWAGLEARTHRTSWNCMRATYDS